MHTAHGPHSHNRTWKMVRSKWWVINNLKSRKMYYVYLEDTGRRAVRMLHVVVDELHRTPGSGSLWSAPTHQISFRQFYFFTFVRLWFVCAELEHQFRNRTRKRNPKETQSSGRLMYGNSHIIWTNIMAEEPVGTLVDAQNENKKKTHTQKHPKSACFSVREFWPSKRN